MKNPLWILTSTLILGCLAAVLFALFARPRIITRASLKTEQGRAPLVKDVSKINAARIYENDLFNTYMRPAPINPVDSAVVPFPLPPMPVMQQAVATPRPQFFDPLDITLKGVLYAYDDRDNRAIIMDNKSGAEQLYKIGDHLEDADIIYIGRNKVVFLRSNGQQETIFINSAAAKNDPIFAQDASWSSVVKRISSTEFTIDQKAFVARIYNPAQLFDMLDLTTAFEKGRSVGLRVGKMDQRSIGPSLGLQYGDIITKVQGIDTTSTERRVEIFDLIKGLGEGATLTVTILRNERDLELLYRIERIKNDEERPSYGALVPSTPIVEAPKQEGSLTEQERFKVVEKSMPSSTMKLIKNHDRHAMLERGGRGALLQRMPQDKPV